MAGRHAAPTGDYHDLLTAVEWHDRHRRTGSFVWTWVSASRRVIPTPPRPRVTDLRGTPRRKARQ